MCGTREEQDITSLPVLGAYPLDFSTTPEVDCAVTSPCDALKDQGALAARSRHSISHPIEDCGLGQPTCVLMRFTFKIFARVITGEMSTQALVDATLRYMAPEIGDCGNVFCESFDEADINRLSGIAILTYNRVSNMLTNEDYLVGV